MVYVPLDVARARALRGGQPVEPLRAHAATAALRRELELGPDDEEADLAALNAAGVTALAGLPGARRLVLAAEVADPQVTEPATAGDALGEVQVSGLTWRQVRSLFADEELAGPAVLAAAEAGGRATPAEVYDLPAVVELTDTYDLLWFAPEELDGLG